MESLRRVLPLFEGARIDDRRRDAGRLWVEDSKQDPRLERLLKEWGFRWASARAAYYYPEN